MVPFWTSNELVAKDGFQDSKLDKPIITYRNITVVAQTHVLILFLQPIDFCRFSHTISQQSRAHASETQMPQQQKKWEYAWRILPRAQHTCTYTAVKCRCGRIVSDEVDSQRKTLWVNIVSEH